MNIRQATENDIAKLYDVAAKMPAHHARGYFERCLDEQRQGNRGIYVSEDGDGLMGYIQLIWSPVYAPFRRLDVPEIQDLNVIPAARGQGIGNALVVYCEELARQAGKTDIGLGVGLHAGFGAAQRLYVRRGYMPDGAGITYDEQGVRAGEMRPIDDLLCLKMIKSLQ